MPEVDANGFDAPDMVGTLDYDLDYGIHSRAYTWAGREFYDPVFGMGLLNTDAGQNRRVRASLNAIPGWSVSGLAASVQGTELVIKAEVS